MNTAEVNTKIQNLLKHLDLLNKELVSLQRHVMDNPHASENRVLLIDECLGRVMTELNQAYSIMVQYDLIDLSST